MHADHKIMSGRPGPYSYPDTHTVRRNDARAEGRVRYFTWCLVSQHTRCSLCVELADVGARTHVGPALGDRLATIKCLEAREAFGVAPD